MTAFEGLLRNYFYRVPPDEVIDELRETKFGQWIKAHYWLGENGEDWKYWSEDHAFCRKARRAGFGVWCDITSSYEVKHLGTQEVTCSRPTPEQQQEAAEKKLATAAE